tara:strand:- start:541 stop:954 length:414 start_codon:yes stop_codon:yes gene_type:complete
MATLVPYKITESGLSSTTTTCDAGGDDFINTGIEFIRIQNRHASATYTVKVAVNPAAVKHPQYGSLAKNNVYKTISGGSDASIFLGPFKQKGFNDSNQKINISYGTGSATSDSGFDGLSAIAGAHLLTVEVLYLDQQ